MKVRFRPLRALDADYNRSVDNLDIIALCGLGWVYDRVEDRYGQATAFVVTLVLGITILAILVAALVAIV